MCVFQMLSEKTKCFHFIIALCLHISRSQVNQRYGVIFFYHFNFKHEIKQIYKAIGSR